MDREQYLVSRISGLSFALDKALALIISMDSEGAEERLELMRAELIQRFKNSGIPAEREMDHSQLVGPALEAIEQAFEKAFRSL